MRESEHRLGEEQQEKERVACPRKCCRRPRVKLALSPMNAEVPAAWHRAESFTVPKGRNVKRTPPRGRAGRGDKDWQRTSGRMPVSAWPAGRILSRKKLRFPTRSTDRAKVSAAMNFAMDLRI